MKQMTTSKKIAQSFGQMQQWLQSLDWKDWLRQIVPEHDPERRSPPPSKQQPTERPSDFEVEPFTLRSVSGPSSEDLARLEREEDEALLEYEEFGPDELIQATAQEEEHPLERDDDELDDSPSAIGDELARRMLRSATGN